MREGGSGSGGREGRLRKGTSKEWMDGAKERGQGGSERREEGPCRCDFGIAGIVMRRNVLFDRWMTLFYVMEII